jgi:hypothetical protein
MNKKNIFSKYVQKIFFERPPKIELKEYSNYIPHNFMTIFCVVYHFALIFIFLLLGVEKLALFNIFSVIVWSLAALLNRKGNQFLSFGLMATEVCLHQTLCVILIGWDTGFQYYGLENK